MLVFLDCVSTFVEAGATERFKRYTLIVFNAIYMYSCENTLFVEQKENIVEALLTAQRYASILSDVATKHFCGLSKGLQLQKY